MNPYKNLADHHFWNQQVSGRATCDIDYDPQPKHQYDVGKDRFATAGSCFAQHFARELVARGGNYTVAEQAHRLEENTDHGYGVFSARYGNIYTTRQLNELLEQVYGVREPVFDIARRADGRWVDLLRARAVPDGFSSAIEAEQNRLFHLTQVKKVLEQSSVFVFTLGLTEHWVNTVNNYSYALCPGVVAGEFDPTIHKFVNESFDQVYTSLAAAIELIQKHHPDIKVLLTVSPVMLVATMEGRGALQSSIASKSILRAVADQCVRDFAHVDYFPSFEIITGPQTQGAFCKHGGRDVSPEGVTCVMDYFFKSRMQLDVEAEQPAAASEQPQKADVPEEEMDALFDVECDEILLGNRN